MSLLPGSFDFTPKKSRGGPHVWENVVAACRRCNSSKGDRLLSEISMVLHRHPTVPRAMSWVLVAVPEVPDTWQPYLEPFHLQTA